jgi:ATP-dependent helicase/nuclease subunit A
MNLTPAQEQAVTTTSRRVCVRAGAGSGKTGVLISRIMHLIETGATTLDRIVAITFTEKAALEMKARLREACRDKAPKDDPEKLTFWRNVERSVSAARISTIHAFCSGLLREHALHLGGDPDFAMLEDADAHLLRHDAAQQELLKLLQASDEDAERIAEELGFDGAFSAMRTLLRNGSEAGRAVARMGDCSVDDVKRAWTESEAATETRALNYLHADPRPMEILDAFKALDGCCDNPEDPREQLRLALIVEVESIRTIAAYSGIPALKARLKERAKNADKSSVWTPEDVPGKVLDIRKRFVSMIGDYCWNTLPEGDENSAAELTSSFLRVYKTIASAYDAAKLSRVSHDFDDLIIRVRKILMENPHIQHRVARSMSHLLIDEFQDTDGLQYDIAQSLYEAKDGPALFVVGDAKQSIYLFRGAEVETFRDAEDSADEVILLDENFRSLPNVLQFVNDFFGETRRLAAVESNYGRLAAHRSAGENARIEFLTPEAPEGKMALGDYRHAEAEILASRLKEMVDQNATVGERGDNGETQRPVRYGDMAILLRAMGEVHIYEQSLRRHGVPFTVVAGAGFYERQEIRDIRNFLSVVVDPSDEMALLAFLRSPLAGLSDESLMRATGVIAESAVPLTRFMASDAALSDPDQQIRLTRARDLLGGTRERREWSAPNLLRYILVETGYEAMLLRQEFLGEQRATNVRKLVALAETFSRTRSPGLIQFLRYLEDVVKTETREGEALELSHDRDAVTIMTIHQSKGLEFPVVAIADAGRSAAGKSEGAVARHRSLGIALRKVNDDGKKLDPAAWACINCMRKWQDRAESARLLYVAMTRARDFLMIGGPAGIGETWMKGFDQWLGLGGRSDSETLSGTDWHGVVWRSPRSAPQRSSDEIPSTPFDVETLRRRVLGVRTTPQLREQSITTLAAKLASVGGRSNDDGRTQASGNPLALIRGTTTHRLLQLWNFKQDARPPISAILHGASLDAVARDQLRDDLEAIADRFQRSALFDKLRNDTGIDRELQLRWMVDGVCINGVIDARLDDGTIVDYKTGSQHASLDSQYIWQLRLYATAIRALTGTTPPRGMLCYLDTEDAPCTEVSFDDATLDKTEGRLREILTTLKAEAV